jgi:hypothetical protein
MDFSAVASSGNSGAVPRGAFFSSTMLCSAMYRDSAPCSCAGIGVGVGVRSNSPNSIIFANRRTSLSSMVAIGTSPLWTARLSAAPKNLPVGSSRSRPAFAEATVLCTAP